MKHDKKDSIPVLIPMVEIVYNIYKICIWKLSQVLIPKVDL